MDEATREALQAVVQELQLITQQVQQVTAQERELATTLETLGKQSPDRPVYRQQGPLLLEVDDREALVAELDDGRSRLVDLQDRLGTREQELRARYEALVKEAEGSA